MKAKPRTVPTHATFRGRPHSLAYVSDEEQQALRAMGGGVAPGGGQYRRHGLLSFEAGDGSDGNSGDASGNDGPGGTGGSSDGTGNADSGEGDGGAGGQGSGSAGGGSDAGEYGNIPGFARGMSQTDIDALKASLLAELRGQYQQPSIDLNPTPVYQPFQAAPQPTAPQGATPGGFQGGLDMLRAFGITRGQQAPGGRPGGHTGGGMATGGVQGQGGPAQASWQPPPPLQPAAPYPAVPLHTGAGSAPAFVNYWNRLAGRPSGTSDYFGMLRGMRGRF